MSRDVVSNAPFDMSTLCEFICSTWKQYPVPELCAHIGLPVGDPCKHYMKGSVIKYELEPGFHVKLLWCMFVKGRSYK